MEKLVWFTPVMTLVGVIIGATLTPVVNGIIEKEKIKRSLKPNLTKNIYLFFNLRKVLVELINKSGLRSRVLNFMWDDLRDLSLDENKRNELLRQYDVFNNAASVNFEKTNIYFQKTIEVESEILSLLALIKTYKGEDIYLKLNSMIKPELDKSNSPLLLHNYRTLTKQESSELSKSIDDQIIKKHKELNSDCDRIIQLVDSTL